MPLIKNGRFAEDLFTLVTDSEALPAGAIIVSLSRFLAERDIVLQRDAPVGVMIAADELPDALGADVHRLAVIALSFPKFRDGRGYSSARVLRERLGYQGEIRAVGQALRDQWLFMHRCGINAFEVREGTRLEDFRAAMNEQTVFYQHASDNVRSIFELRHLRVARPVLAAE